MITRRQVLLGAGAVAAAVALPAVISAKASPQPPHGFNNRDVVYVYAENKTSEALHFDFTNGGVQSTRWYVPPGGHVRLGMSAEEWVEYGGISAEPGLAMRVSVWHG